MSRRGRRACQTGKKGYHDESEAKRARQNVGNGLRVGRLQDTGKQPVRYYRCPLCGQYHLTGLQTYNPPLPTEK